MTSVEGLFGLLFGLHLLLERHLPTREESLPVREEEDLRVDPFVILHDAYAHLGACILSM